MSPILRAESPCKSNQSYLDGVEDDCRNLAARIVAARFGLPSNVAVLVCHLAGIGEVRQ